MVKKEAAVIRSLNKGSLFVRIKNDHLKSILLNEKKNPENIHAPFLFRNMR